MTTSDLADYFIIAWMIASAGVLGLIVLSVTQATRRFTRQKQ